ncbi:hypothetical protein GYMLUDRAFT_180863, partial [Collybiopsis luxurians FD-317 M1]
DPLEAIKALWGDLSFANDLVYKPAKMFQSQKQTKEERMYAEMWTSGFWNAAQGHFPLLFKLRTITPVIIVSDETQLTNFSGGKLVISVV